MSGIAFFQSPEALSRDPPLGISEESKTGLKKYQETCEHYYLPISRQNNVVQEFYNLASKWREEVQYSSSIVEICMSPSYQKIIGMGEKILPLIFRELAVRPDHWFWALKSITGADPIQSHQRGKISEMARAWLNWARENGYK